MIFFAVPFFKNVSFLRDTLQSLVSQTSPNWSVVVLDDSLDQAEAESAKQCVLNFKDPRIQYSRNSKNIGMSNNWNQGLDLGKKHPNAIATSILHADDRLLPNYVMNMLNALNNFPETAAFFCRAVVIDGEGRRAFSFTDFYKEYLLPDRVKGVITLSGIDGIRILIPGNFIFCPTFCFRNSRLNFQFNTQLKMVTDFDLTLELLLQGHQLKGLYSQALFEYRRHASNTTNVMNQNLERFKEERDLYLRLANQLEKKGCIQLAKNARRLKIIKKNLLFLMVTSFLKGKFTLMNRYFQFFIRLN